MKIHLKRQLDFIRSSSDCYDNGEEHEAVRIAQAIRVLMHDTTQSTSILAQIGEKSKIKLLTVCDTSPIAPGTCVMDLVSIMTLEGIKPSLNQSGFKDFIPVADWWTQIVLITGSTQKHSRASITLATANFDGGAHVDLRVDNKKKLDFRTLKDGFWTFEKDGISQRLTEYHFIAIRQFAYELINSPDLIALSV